MTPHFVFGESGRLVVEQVDDLWLVHEPFDYFCGDGMVVHIPEHLTTDFASVPRIFWNLFPPFHHCYAAAAVVHDDLYGTHAVTRRRADEIFREAMTVSGTPWVRWVLWSAVRIFGGMAYASGQQRRHGRAEGLARILAVSRSRR